MSSTRELRRRIRSISGTAQITNAMQMVAASKMRKAQQAAIEVRPFAQMVYRIQRIATTRAIDYTHPLLEKREVKTRAIILVGSDKGLCGPLNSNLFRLAGRYDPNNTVFIAAGRKAAQFVARTRRQLVAEFPYGDTPRFAESRAIAAMARDLFLKHEVDEVLFLATQFINTLVQQATMMEFLPIGDIHSVKVPAATPPDHADKHEYLFEPNPDDLIPYLLGHYLNVQVHLVLLNAKASEQSARMVSMKNATENAGTLIKDLTLAYNKLRQGHITQELLEIAGGRAS